MGFITVLPDIRRLDLIRHRWSWKFDHALWLCALTALLIYPLAKYAPIEWGYENGVVENTQMLILFAAMVLCFFAQKNRPFFIFIAGILLIMALRETNFGKTLFYPDPERPNKFLSWDEIPYAPYVDPVMIVYTVALVFYGLKKKLYCLIPEYLKSGELPAWHIAIMVISMISGTLIDKCWHNLIAEEMAELVFYIAMTCAIFRAGRKSCSWLPEAE